ncbi:MAG: CHAT domain-containing protein, partial [Acidobacteriota bacterium]
LRGPLYVFWDPGLPQIPLEAVHSPAGPGPLVRHAAVTYLATIGSLGRQTAGRGSGALVFGAPDYGPIAGATAARAPSTRGCVDQASLHRFVAIAGTGDEARRLERILRQHRVPVTARTGAAAGEAAFRRDVAGRRFVLVATHGYFLGGECAAPGGTRGMVLEGKAAPAAAKSGGTLYQRRIAAMHPLLRAGLAFAGANRTGNRAGEDDGHLMALEASTLDLRGTELVVLSACETGVGERVHNEGVMGLSRAFLVAGADGVGMSLWSVSDLETTELVTTWISRIMGGHTVAEALRQAKLQLIESLSRRDSVAHPFFWSAFVYTR